MEAIPRGISLLWEKIKLNKNILKNEKGAPPGIIFFSGILDTSYCKGPSSPKVEESQDLRIQDDTLNTSYN